MERLTSLKRILNLPRDSKGWALTFDTGTTCDWVPEHEKVGVGKANHIVVDMCWRQGKCGVCGDDIEGYFYFVVGSADLEDGLQPGSDAPLHRDCARASMTVCPALANPDLNNPRHYHNPVLVRCRRYDADGADEDGLSYELVELPKLVKPSGCPVSAAKRFLGIGGSQAALSQAV